ncbi:hypothetical protein C8J35_103507 [Rhizobium sp. PP-F2F-G38]|nr:hypothetical protein C8J35_103507 [Rhizobium sp. PP-F2F-G38]
MGILLQTPDILIYAAVGAVLGGIGGALGVPLAKKRGFAWAKFLPVVGVALTPVLTKEYVMPWVTVARINEDLPKKIDEQTTLTSFEVEGRQWIYHYAVSDPKEVIPGSDLKAFLSQSACTELTGTFRSGRVDKVTYSYQFESGQSSFDLVKADCEASGTASPL